MHYVTEIQSVNRCVFLFVFLANILYFSPVLRHDIFQPTKTSILKRFLLFIFYLLLNFSIYGQSTLSVPSQYSTIQAAINASSNGDIVLVSPGSYNSIDIINKDITVASLYYTTNDPSYIGITIIDGANNNTVIEIDGGVGMISLIGLTIQNGSGEFWGNSSGGVHIADASSSGANVTMDNVIITNNTSTDQAGGILIRQQSNLTITNSVISYNTAARGGAMLIVEGSYVSLDNVLITENSISSYGGAIGINDRADMDINNCTITNNSCGTDGGGIWMKYSSTNITEVTIDSTEIRGNVCVNNTGHGGGISVWDGAKLVVSYSKIKDNQNNTGGGIYSFNSDIDIRYTEITQNTAINDGGGITISATEYSNTFLANLTFADNISNIGSALKFANNGGSINNTIINCILWGAISNNVSLNISYCD